MLLKIHVIISGLGYIGWLLDKQRFMWNWSIEYNWSIW